MKKTACILSALCFYLLEVSAAPLETFNNGDSNAGVRSKLNATILQTNTNTTDIAANTAAIEAIPTNILDTASKTYVDAGDAALSNWTGVVITETALSLVQPSDWAATNAAFVLVDESLQTQIDNIESGTSTNLGEAAYYDVGTETNQIPTNADLEAYAVDGDFLLENMIDENGATNTVVDYVADNAVANADGVATNLTVRESFMLTSSVTNNNGAEATPVQFSYTEGSGVWENHLYNTLFLLGGTDNQSQLLGFNAWAAEMYDLPIMQTSYRVEFGNPDGPHGSGQLGATVDWVEDNYAPIEGGSYPVFQVSLLTYISGYGVVPLSEVEIKCSVDNLYAGTIDEQEIYWGSTMHAFNDDPTLYSGNTLAQWYLVSNNSDRSLRVIYGGQTGAALNEFNIDTSIDTTLHDRVVLGHIVTIIPSGVDGDGDPWGWMYEGNEDLHWSCRVSKNLADYAGGISAWSPAVGTWFPIEPVRWTTNRRSLP